MQFGESKKSTDLLEIDPFTQAFYEIDQDGDGVISKTDLENFVRLNNLGDDTLVKSWMRLFDVSNGDHITLGAYRVKLGLREDGGYHPRKPSVSSPPPAGILPREKMQDHPRESEVRVISASMPVGRREEIVRYLKNLLVSDSQISETQLVAALKRWLEAKYEPTWHVLAIKGSYWMHYSHEVDCSFQFHLGSHVYLMWRTPTG